jgi:hypothetical protein
MNKSSAQDQTPGGFEGRAGGSKGNPTPTAKYDSLTFAECYEGLWFDAAKYMHELDPDAKRVLLDNLWELYST